MGGFFGCTSKEACNKELFYGTDYLSHLGTKRGGLATLDTDGFHRTIHSLENAYFRSKFESDLDELSGNMGIGVISDTDPQPIIIHSHLGTFAMVTVGKVANLDELVAQAYKQHLHFSETSQGSINPTELVATIVCQGASFKEGLEKAQALVKGSCSMLLLCEEGIYAARDRLGRTPIVIGQRDNAYAASSESSAFTNLGFETAHYVGPGEIVRLTAEGMEQITPPGDKMQVCSFLWVYYGYPASSYEGINT
ncbi:MAG: amidophosphoribosyltransferase, partial [Desulfobacterales bacterium]|nr:amidophosphoribosyltransferase [Desulfobacterales bacterium]